MDLIPDIEENVPLPLRALDAMPKLSPKEELEMRARTIKLLYDLNGTPLEPSDKNIKDAEDLARQMMQDPYTKPAFSSYPNETLAYLAGMVQQMNVQLVDELSDLKMYVVNKLIQEVETSKDSKSRIMALTKLGEVDGVDAFKKRTEHTVKLTIEEVEQELRKYLDVVDVKFEETKLIGSLETLEDEETTNDDSVE
jgi:hypothetical protein